MLNIMPVFRRANDDIPRYWAVGGVDGCLFCYIGKGRVMSGESVKNGGKGDNDRTKDRKQYAKNHDKVIFGKRDKTNDTFKVNIK